MTPISLAELETQPFRFSASARIDAAPHAIFEELRDMSLWFPLMNRSVWHTAATGGVGAERDVHVHGLGFARERMLAWEPGKRIAYTIIESSSPLMEKMGEDWQIGDGRVTWSVAVTPTTIGRVAQPALRVILRALFLRAVRSLERRARTYPGYSGKQVS